MKPHSRKKTARLDHIAEVHTMLGAKYGKGHHWIIAGDTNDMKVGSIPDIDPNLKSIVKKTTRINPNNPNKNSLQ